jgi:hypothetical protein
MSANNCTIELVHGGTVHVEEDYEDLSRRWEECFLTGQPFRVLRSENYMSREARGFRAVSLNPTHVVGIYPLTSTSWRDPDPQRTMLVRTELTGDAAAVARQAADRAARAAQEALS